MAILTTSAFTLLCALFIASTNTIPKKSSPKPLPTQSNLQPFVTTHTTSSDTPRLKKRYPLRNKPTYAFGALAAESLDQARALGFIKNDNPANSGNSHGENLKVGHCVIVPRNDHSFSYGVVTEEITPGLVCVACDNKSLHHDGFTIKIMPANELFLEPEWLHTLPKDPATLNLYKRDSAQTRTGSKTLPKEESYEPFPDILAKNRTKK